MRFPAFLVWITMLLASHGQATAESCAYLFEGAGGGDNRRMTMTQRYPLQEYLDRNSTSVNVLATRMDFLSEKQSPRYVRVDFSEQRFVETEGEAEDISKEHSRKVPKGFPLMISFADDSSIILTSLGMFFSGGALPVAPPGTYGNDTKLFRVTFFYSGAYSVDEDQRTTLMAQPVKRLQMTTAQGDYHLDVDPSKADRLQFILGCI